MLLILGTIRLPPESLGRARTAMERMILASRAEDGCLAYSYSEDVLDQGLIRVEELWRDQSSLDEHWTSPHISEWRDQWPSLGITERKLLRYEVSAATIV